MDKISKKIIIGGLCETLLFEQKFAEKSNDWIPVKLIPIHPNKIRRNHLKYKNSAKKLLKDQLSIRRW